MIKHHLRTKLVLTTAMFLSHQAYAVKPMGGGDSFIYAFEKVASFDVVTDFIKSIKSGKHDLKHKKNKSKGNNDNNTTVGDGNPDNGNNGNQGDGNNGNTGNQGNAGGNAGNGNSGNNNSGNDNNTTVGDGNPDNGNNGNQGDGNNGNTGNQGNAGDSSGNTGGGSSGSDGSTGDSSGNTGGGSSGSDGSTGDNSGNTGGGNEDQSDVNNDDASGSKEEDASSEEEQTEEEKKAVEARALADKLTAEKAAKEKAEKEAANNSLISDTIDTLLLVDSVEDTVKINVEAQVTAYTSLPTIGREIVMSELDTLHNRLGELRNNQGWVGSGPSHLKTNLGEGWHNAINFDDSRVNVWLKGSLNSFDIEESHSFDISGTYGGFNLGVDKKFDLGSSWNVYTGLFTGYKTGRFETSGETNQYISDNKADIDINTWSIGGYGTFFNGAGSYVDLVVEYMDFSADIKSLDLSSSADGYAVSGSVEVGHSFDLAKDWIIEPQAQLKLAYIDWDDFYDGTNNVSFENHTYITGRTGIRVEKTLKSGAGEIKPWAYIGAIHEFSDASKVTYGDMSFDTHDYNTAGEAKLGVTADVYSGFQLYIDGGYASDFKDYNAAKGNLGIRLSW